MQNKSHTVRDVFVRVHHPDGKFILDRIQNTFPCIRCSEAAGGENTKYRLLVTFIPPDDEPLSNYQHIHSTGAGVDAICSRISGLPCTPVITRTLGRMGAQIAEYCAAYSLAFLQSFETRNTLQKMHIWDQEKASPKYLFDSKVTVVGTGKIGSSIAKVFKGFGAYVTGLSLSGGSRPYFDKINRFEDSVPCNADIVVTALPRTPKTDTLIDDGFFEKLDHALFINVGRGAVVSEDALKNALEQKHISRAILDVFGTEPISGDHWAWQNSRVVVTPHVAGLTLREDILDTLTPLLSRIISGEAIDSDVQIARGY